MPEEPIRQPVLLEEHLISAALKILQTLKQWALEGRSFVWDSMMKNLGPAGRQALFATWLLRG